MRIFPKLIKDKINKAHPNRTDITLSDTTHIRYIVKKSSLFLYVPILLIPRNMMNIDVSTYSIDSLIGRSSNVGKNIIEKVIASTQARI
jgi:hypothetical protein